MANTSPKDTLKAIHSFFSSSDPSQSLSDGLQRTIIESTDSAGAIEEALSQRVHDDLLNIYSELVAKDKSKLSAFLQALQLFRPFVIGLDRKLKWWSLVLEPVINRLGQKRVETEQASAFVLGMYEYDSGEDKKGEMQREAKAFTDLLVDTYLRRAKPAVSQDEDYSLENEHLATQLEQLLVAVGKKKPRLLLLTVDSKVAERDNRIAALGLLSAFVRHQPPHLYSISETPLVEHLLQCLMIDTSVTAVQIALTVLIMFLPHIPRSIQTHLSRLFLIYSRLICWDQIRAGDDDYNKADVEEEQSGVHSRLPANSSWDKLEAPLDQEEPASLDLTFYFTFLYGLYPLNFVQYIRRPRRYLKEVHFPRAEELELDQDLIKSRTEIFRQVHLLHPNFLNTTAEEELADGKWLQTDAADVVAECISLRLSLYPSLDSPGPPPSAKLPSIPSSQTKTKDIPSQNLVSSDDGSLPFGGSLVNTGIQPPYANKHRLGVDQLPVVSDERGPSQRTAAAARPRTPRTPSSANSPAVHPRADPGDSPTLGPVEVQSTRPSTASMPSSAGKVTHVGTDSRSLDDYSKVLLQRQLAIVKNDLNFERYLKQQHLAHIGQLQRRHVNDATVSANTENLVNTNKSLKAKLTKANDSYSSLRKESSTGRTQSKKFETELSARVRSLREAERQWSAEEETLRVELAKAQRDCDALRQLMVESESRELNSRQQVASMELELEQVESLRKRMRELESKVKGLEAQEMKFTQAIEDNDMLRVELATAKLEKKSQDSAHERYRKSTERLIDELQARLAEGESLPQSPESQSALQTALTAANNRYNTLRKDYTKLKHNYVELEVRCQELEELESEAADGAKGSLNRDSDSPRRRPVSFGSDDFPQSGYASSSSWQSGPRGAATVGTKGGHLFGGSSHALGSSPKPGPALPPQRPDRRTSRSSVISGAGSESSRRVYKNHQSVFSMESLNDGDSSDKSKTKVQPDSEMRVFGRGESPAHPRF